MQRSIYGPCGKTKTLRARLRESVGRGRRSALVAESWWRLHRTTPPFGVAVLNAAIWTNDSERRTFELWEAPARSPTFIFNSTELRIVNVVLEVVRPSRQETRLVCGGS
jgi:hypothetical protein